MYDALTQQQKWGYQYAALVRNANATGGRTNWTAQEVAADRLATIGNDYWTTLVDYKNGLMRTAFTNASAEIQQQVQTLLGVSDVL